MTSINEVLLETRGVILNYKNEDETEIDEAEEEDAAEQELETTEIEEEGESF